MVTYKIYSDIGDREVNEDSVGEWDENGRYCFVVADGLGGHGFGEVASSIAVVEAINLFGKGSSECFLRDCFETVQDKVLEKQSEDIKLVDMKTTMVTLAIDGNGVTWGHIGDSRLYYINHNRIISRTLDHSVPQMLVNTGEIKEKEIRGHEDRNRLLRVVGSPWTSKSYDLSDRIPIKKCQAFLLCTDGFWELILEKDIVRTLKKAQTVEEWMDSMVEIVNLNGQDINMDNNSAIAIWIN